MVTPGFIESMLLIFLMIVWLLNNYIKQSKPKPKKKAKAKSKIQTRDKCIIIPEEELNNIIFLTLDMEEELEEEEP